MNLGYIKLIACLSCFMPCVWYKTIYFHKFASAMPTSVKREFNLRRTQKFIAKYALNLDLVARLIFSQLPVKTGLVLSMDRTSGKFGDFDVNVLMLDMTYKGIHPVSSADTCPIYFSFPYFYLLLYTKKPYISVYLKL